MTKFAVGAIVEQTDKGDLPCLVLAVKSGPVNRYTVEAIDRTLYQNIPEYMLKAARPASQSKWGNN